MRKEMPTAVTMYPVQRQLRFFLIGWLGFQIIGLIVSLPFYISALIQFGDNMQAIEEAVSKATVSMFTNCITYCITFVVLLFNSMPQLRELFSKFKGVTPYIAAVIGVLAIYVFNILYNTILATFNVTINDNINQSSLNTIVHSYPIISVLVLAIIGPVCEELTYRVGLFSLCKRKNRLVAYTVTIIVFTLIHVEFTTNSWLNELLNIPFYAFAAGTFCFLYDRYGFGASTTAHVINNMMSILLTIFAK